MEANSKKMWIRYGSVAVILLAAYFINVEFQSYKGEQARQQTGLDAVPFEKALEQSKKTGQPVLANLSAVWCPTCRVLEEKIFSDPAINRKIRNDFIFTRLEYESEAGRAFSKRYGLTGFPHVLALDSQGRVLRPIPVLFNEKVYLHNLDLEKPVIETVEKADVTP